MQTFFPQRRVRRIIAAIGILLPVISFGLYHDAGSGWFGLACWCLMILFILALLLLNFCRVEIHADELAFYYPFRLFRKRRSYSFQEIGEVILSAYGDTPTISVIFKEAFRRETMYREGYSHARSHFFSRRQTAAIAEAMRAAGIHATAVDHRIQRKG